MNFFKPISYNVSFYINLIIMGSKLCIKHIDCDLTQLNIFGNRRQPLKKTLINLDDDIDYQKTFSIKRTKIKY